MSKFKYIFLLIMLFWAISDLKGQEECGMKITSAQIEMMRDFSISRMNMTTVDSGVQAAQTIRKVAITAHIIRKSDGTGGLTDQELNDAMVILNNYYLNADFEFFIFYTNYIHDDQYYNFVDSDEAQMGAQYDIPNTINIYFANSVGNGQGTFYCGYAYFPGGPDRILMDNGCTIAGNTLSHELGHYFTLYHTHGKINGVLTDECVDGSNCATGGDEICDTPADPQLGFNNVDVACIYIGTTVDNCNGDLFNPDPTNIMSYSRGACRNTLSVQQYDRMNAAYDAFRSYLFTSNQFDVVANASPSAGGTVSGSGTYTFGDNVAMIATPQPGYSLVNWTENNLEVSNELNYNFIITSDRTLTANFAYIGFSISATSMPLAGGSVSGTGVFDLGDQATLTATPSIGYNFINWTENNIEVSNQLIYSFTVTGDRSLTANFELIDYNITATVNPALSGSVTGAGVYNYGDFAQLTATPETGYGFVNWTENTIEVSTQSNYGFNVEGNRNLAANFALEYTISVDLNPVEGGSVSGTGIYLIGDLAQLLAIPETGYLFVNWTEVGIEVSTQLDYSFTVDGDRTLTANFALIDYMISIEANPVSGGGVFGGGIYNYGDAVQLVATPVVGYTFVNWVENGTAVSTESPYIFSVEGDRTLVANFEIANYLIVASSNPLNGASIAGVGTYLYGEMIELVVTPAIGYQFINWQENGVVVSSELSYSFEVSEDRTLIANLEILKYNISANSEPDIGGSVSGMGTYNYGSTAQLIASPTTGYRFLNWIVDGIDGPTEPIISFTVVQDHNLTANFEEIEYYIISINSSPENSGLTTGSGTYEKGDFVEVTALPQPGYNFMNWTENNVVVSDEGVYSFIATGDRTLTSNFALTDYTISASVSPDGSGSLAGLGTYNYDGNADLIAIPEPGYLFVNWTENGLEVSDSPGYSFSVYGDRNLLANFELIDYNISASSDSEDGGTISGMGIYNYGNLVELIASPKPGYKFINWTEVGVVVSSESTYSFSVTNDLALIAHFELINYIISAISNPANAGTISGVGTFNYGETGSLDAVAEPGYRFVNWTEDAVEVATESSFNFEVDSDRNLVANFELIDYNISVISDPIEGGTVTGSGIYHYNETAVLFASPEPDYNFVSWAEDGIEVYDKPEYSFSVSGDRNIVVHFLKPLGIEDFQSDLVKFFPNPVQSTLNIYLIDNQLTIDMIFDLSGREFYPDIIKDSDQLIVDFSNFNSGYYYLRLRSQDSFHLIKVFKK